MARPTGGGGGWLLGDAGTGERTTTTTVDRGSGGRGRRDDRHRKARVRRTLARRARGVAGRWATGDAQTMMYKRYQRPKNNKTLYGLFERCIAIHFLYVKDSENTM